MLWRIHIKCNSTKCATHVCEHVVHTYTHLFFLVWEEKNTSRTTSELECVLHADDDTGVKITQPYSLCMRALPPHVLIGLRHISKLPSASLECVSFTHESEVVSTFTERHYVSARRMCLLCRAVKESGKEWGRREASPRNESKTGRKSRGRKMYLVWIR